MSNKRKFESLEDVTEANNAEVHFGVEILSPIKQSKSGYDYYNGQVSDGTKSMRLVGFDDTSRNRLAPFVQKKTPVKATSCAIKKSRTTDDLEIHVNKGTTFTASPRRLTFQYTETIDASIEQATSLDDGMHVNIKATVITVAPERTVSTGVVQEVTIQDETGTIDLSLWNNNVDTVYERYTYDFKNLTVHTYRNNKVLRFTSDTTIIKQEQDSINVSTATDSETLNANLIGIQGFRIHVWCLHCDSKLQFSDTTAECEKCHLLQLIRSCKYKVTCRMMFKTIETEPQCHLLSSSTEVFLKLLQLVSENTALSLGAHVTVLQLSMEQIFTVSHNGEVITDIAKCIAED